MKVGAVIVGAGMSSRMDDFKPLLKIGKYMMAEWPIANFRNAGIEEIVMVTGFRADILEKQLKKWDIFFVRNDQYQSSQMFDSVSMGLQYLQERCDRVIVTPVDAPLIRSDTIRQILAVNSEIVVPTYGGKKGHPIVLSQKAAAEVLSFSGKRGLKGAIEVSKYSVCYVETNDEEVLNDIDTQADYLNILTRYSKKQMRGQILPDQERISFIWELYQVPDHIREHMRMVTHLAMEMEEKLRRSGAILNPKLIYAGGMLHDLCRMEPNHQEKAAEAMRNWGYPKLAEVIRIHHSGEEQLILTEANLIFLADKMIHRTSRVSIEERFINSLPKCRTKAAQEAHKKRKQYAIKLYRLYQELIHPFF